MNDFRCSSLQNRPIIKFDPRLTEQVKRNYCREAGWMKRYIHATENGDVIDTTWAYNNNFSVSREAARKKLNRDCNAGIIAAIIPWTYPRSYKLVKNVTLHRENSPAKPAVIQAHQISCLDRKPSTNNPSLSQSPQKKEHSLHAPTTISNATKTSTRTLLVSSSSAPAAYMTAFPDCHCKGSYICDSCERLPTVFSTAFDRLQSAITVTIPSSSDVVVSCSKPSISPTLIPASELLRVKAPTYPRWTKYGLLGRRWHDEAPLAYDAVDKLQPTDALRPVHRLYFETYDERGAFSREFETQSIHNKQIPTNIIVDFDGLHIPIHVARYKRGKVILMAELSETPIPADRISDFRRAIQVALSFETPSSETWMITATDLGRDLPTLETRRRSMKESNYKGFTIHAYNKPINGHRYLRVEVQLNPSTANYEEYLTILERANKVLLEACGKA